MSDANPAAEQLVPDSVIPHKTLPPLRYRDMPEAPPWRKMVGPSIILAGLALGSGEFIFWPYLTYKIGFGFFWACMLGVLTQFFINMEIERWTLATGESAITGFCRLSRNWAWIMLILNFVPWVWPGWATGASTLLSWMLFGAVETTSAPLAAVPSAAFPTDLREHVSYHDGKRVLAWRGPMSTDQRDRLLALSTDASYQAAVTTVFDQVRDSRKVRYEARYVPYIAIASLFLIGFVLTTGPVVYNTVERLQVWLVGMIFVIAVLLGILVVKPYAITAMLAGTVNLGNMPDESSGLGLMALLGALAFAGAGGTMNLGQSNFIKDKGYGMGKYVGRITSPITGNEEAIADVGYHFPHTPENMRRWRDWWKAANVEHFFSFYITCVVCLVLLALISFSLFRDAARNLKPGMERFGEGFDFVWGEADQIAGLFASPTAGGVFRVLFFVMGMALLLTTELGVLDASARISADIIKVNYLRENDRWSLGRLYFMLLWGEILLSAGILFAGALNPDLSQPLFLLQTSAAMNGGVMFIYSLILLYMNNKILSRSLSMSPVRFVALVWACAFFGYFTFLALKFEVVPYMRGFLGAVLP